LIKKTDCFSLSLQPTHLAYLLHHLENLNGSRQQNNSHLTTWGVLMSRSRFSAFRLQWFIGRQYWLDNTTPKHSPILFNRHNIEVNNRLHLTQAYTYSSLTELRYKFVQFRRGSRIPQTKCLNLRARNRWPL